MRLKFCHKVIEAIHLKLNLSNYLAKEWKVHRRLVSPTINQTSVAAPVFNENIRKIISNLSTMGGFFDILPTIAQCKMIMFVEAALGTEWEPEIKQRYLQQFVAYVT